MPLPLSDLCLVFVRFDCPWGRNVEPIWFEFFFVGIDLQTEETFLFSGSDSIGPVGEAIPFGKKALKKEVA
jgi:hypothetical protein